MSPAKQPETAMKYVMPMIALLCAATISAQSLSNSNSDRTIGGTDNPPGSDVLIAMNDDFKVINGETFELGAPGVLGNDEGEELVPVLYQPAPEEDPSYQPVGTLTLFKDGALHYQPVPGFEGVDTFLYFVTDANGNEAKAEINFYCINEFVVNSDEFKVLNGETLNMEAPGVLGNDLGVDLTAALIDPTELGDDIVPPQGALTLNADGSFSYVPVPGFAGVDTFYFMVTDIAGRTAKCTVSFYCITEGSEILAADALSMGEGASDESGACSAGAGAAPWMLLPMIGLALMRMRRARA